MSKPINEKPNASEYGQMVSFLAKHGVNPSDIRKKIGTSPNNRSRSKIIQELKNWLRIGTI